MRGMARLTDWCSPQVPLIIKIITTKIPTATPSVTFPNNAAAQRAGTSRHNFSCRNEYILGFWKVWPKKPISYKCYHASEAVCSRKRFCGWQWSGGSRGSLAPSIPPAATRGSQSINLSWNLHQIICISLSVYQHSDLELEPDRDSNFVPHQNIVSAIQPPASCRLF